MSFLDEITVLILTYNEEANIGRTLDALVAFPEIVVVDSGSTDGTAKIVRSRRNARLITRPFDSHASQWNSGLAMCNARWVLALDADYILPRSLVDFITELSPAKTTSGYMVNFRYCIFGYPLSASLYPPLIVLFRREGASFAQEGHTQRLQVDGAIETLPYEVDHDDRKPVTRWFISQAKYANLEADHLLSIPKAELRAVDRIRLNGWAAPILVLIYTLLFKRCVLDGWRGWYYVMQRVVAETMLAIEIIDRRLRQTND